MLTTISNFASEYPFSSYAILGAISVFFALRFATPSKGAKPSMVWKFLKACWEFRTQDFTKFVEDHKRMFAIAKQKKDHAEVTSHWYDLMGSFIEMYYGPCFHFCPPETANQSRTDAIASLHNRIARLLELAPGKKCLDVGCGIGGIMQDMGQYTGADITGLTLSNEEVRRGNEILREMGLDFQCRLTQGDAQDMPYADESFDCVYAVYSLKYFTSLDRVLGHVARVLKPGGTFLVYCILKTDNYDVKNAEHVKVVSDFEFACGMPSLHTKQGLVEECARVGLDCVSQLDASTVTPWYYEFDNKALHFMLTSPVAKAGLRAVEAVRILPKGFSSFMDVVVRGNIMNIYKAGKMGILSGSPIVIFRKGTDGKLSATSTVTTKH